MLKFNWVDLLLAVLTVRTGFSGFEKGFLTELFKFTATVAATLLGLHFFPSISGFLEARLFFPQRSAEVASIILVLIFCALLLFLLRIFLDRIFPGVFKAEKFKAAAMLLGGMRGLIIGSLLLIILSLIPGEYIRKSIEEKSLATPVVVQMAPAAYRFLAGIVPGVRSKELKIDILRRHR